MHNKRKKVTRKRGSETHGHGASKKWRGAGHRGGRGKAGSGKRGDAKIMKVTKGNKKYLGKYGFTSKRPTLENVINLSTLQEKLDSLLLENKIKQEKNIYLIDLKQLGYDKLLSKGNVRFPMNIIVDKATAGAIRKVESAGGKVSLPEKKNQE